MAGALAGFSPILPARRIQNKDNCQVRQHRSRRSWRVRGTVVKLVSPVDVLRLTHPRRAIPPFLLAAVGHVCHDDPSAV
jgi:hypothetical protein